MSALFSALQIGALELPNRIVVSPMCQYSAREGQANEWHMQHLMQLALSGAGLVMVEATAVEPRGRISHGCLGLYSDATEAALARVLAAARAVAAPYARLGIQLAHAGRKGSADAPWLGGRPLAPQAGTWRCVATSATPFAGWTALPAGCVLGARITGTDWLPGGLDIEDAVSLAGQLRQAGVDYVCVTSGFVVRGARIPFGPGYQAGLAEQVRRRTGMPVRAVGGIADPRQAQAIIETGQADQVALARAFLADPRWVWRAAETLGAPAYYAPQYRLGAGLRA
ncbi:putative NADH:flavin oxidoreductase [Bordetella bronchiseptica MO211]|nr:putative NADH:flavin oxidoreductase [Bordetella bronchiseptica MO211]